MMQVLQKTENILFYLLLFFLPTQLGKHFWPDFSFVAGLRVDYLSPTVYVTDLLIGALFICWAIRYSLERNSIHNKKQKTIFPFSLFLYVLFSAFLLVTILISDNFLHGLYQLLKFFEFSFLSYYVASTVTRNEQIKKIMLAFSCGVILESILAVLQSLQQHSLGGIWYFFGERSFSSVTPGIANTAIDGHLVLRSYGTFSHPNVLAGFLLISLMLILYSLICHSWQKMRSLLIATLFIGTAALLLTLSRIPIALWFLLLVLSCLTSFRRNSNKQKIQMSIVFGLLVFLLLILVSPVSSRFLHSSVAEESVTQREYLLQAALSQSILHPLFGVGFGNFLPSLGLIHRGFSFGVLLQPVHNIFILILVETGIVGLAGFLWFLFVTYRRVCSLSHDTKSPWYFFQMVLLSAVLVLGCFDHYLLTLQQGQLLFSLVVGFSWITLHEKR